MKTSADHAIDQILAAGETLVFNGDSFEEKSRPRGTGPTYKMKDVLLRARAGRAMITTVGTDAIHNEIEVRRAPQRVSA